MAKKVGKAKPSNHKINLNELIYPIFVKEGRDIREKIASLPGIYRFSPDEAIREVTSCHDLGLNQFLVFGIPPQKEAIGSYAAFPDNVVSVCVRQLKALLPRAVISTDVCLCAYTDHGHCGVIPKGQQGIDHKKTLAALSAMALTHARAGADFVAPSAMAEGQVAAIRAALDTAGYRRTRIMGYSAKFASQFYGPFRQVADSAPRFGDREGYQIPVTETSRVEVEILADIREGADVVMVKPALAYLDVIARVKAVTSYPLAVYNVSGEYAMVKYGARLGYWDERKMVAEVLGAMKRAGADLIITYHAKDIAEWQAGKE